MSEVVKRETTAVATSREELLASMNEATRKVALEGERHISKAYRGLVLVQYDLGKKVAEVVAKEAVYGSNAVAQLAAYWNISGGTTTLYNLRSFATAFSRDFVEQWSNVPLKTGGHLTLGHWLKLLAAPPDQRETFLRRAVDEGWSTRELAWEIRAAAAEGIDVETPADRRRGQGRAVKPFTSPQAGLEALISKTEAVLRVEDQLHSSVLGSLDDLSPDKFSEAFLERVLTAREELLSLMRKSKEMVLKLTQFAKRIKETLRARAKTPSE